MISALIVATAVLCAVTLLPLLHFRHWVVRGLDFPRLQFACYAALLLFFQGLLLDAHTSTVLVLMGLTLLCLLWQVAWIIPYTPIWRPEVLSAGEIRIHDKIRILTQNVLMTNRSANKLLSLITQHNTDILVTLETDLWWETQLDELLPDMPYTVRCPLDNYYGMHVYSRIPFDDTEIAYLVEDDKPSIHTLLTLPCGDQVQLYFVHPAPPSPTENNESTERDAELVTIARDIAGKTDPIIVTGDLNDVAWSATTRLFRRLSGLLDPRIGRGLFNTFHARWLPIRWPLDHVFHSSHFRVGSIKRLPSIDSDHFGLFTELIYSPQNVNEHDTPSSDVDDMERSHTIVEALDSPPQKVPDLDR